MQPTLVRGFGVGVFLLLLCPAALLPARAAATIDPANHYAWGENIGWVDWYADGSNGAVVNDYFCSGYLWSANVGWINLGSGAPVNGIRYQNLAANDFGVNNDGLGSLRGYAWGANIGWIAFEAIGNPRLDIRTGMFSGYVWAANCGWISLANSSATVRTAHILQGPLAANGLPIPWLLANFGNTSVDPNADPDHDGMSNAQEYWADTNPNDANDKLRITSQSFTAGGTSARLTWSSEPTRSYFILKTTSLNAPVLWTDGGLGIIASDGSSTARTLSDVNAPARFYRVQVVRPLP